MIGSYRELSEGHEFSTPSLQAMEDWNDNPQDEDLSLSIPSSPLTEHEGLDIQVPPEVPIEPTPVVEPEPEPTFKVADAPFDDRDADVILISSNEVRFYVYRAILCLVSSAFKDMLQNTAPDKKIGLPIIHVTEKSQNLWHFLTWCDPRCISSDTVVDLLIALELTEKYSAPSLKKRVTHALAQKIQFEPISLRVFTNAALYKLPDLGRVAAERTLSLTMEDRSREDLAEFDLVQATVLHKLNKYYFACRSALAVQVFGTYSWVLSAYFQWSSNSSCQCSREIRDNRGWKAWWVDYMDHAARELAERPCAATLEGMLTRAPLLRSCNSCRPTMLSQLRFFESGLFTEQVNNVISNVKLMLNFEA